MIGQTISHYRIIERLGAGGMGVVYKAQDLKLPRFVALKFLPPHLSTDENAKQRFIHEAEAASALDHPNIGTIYEVDETPDGQMFIAMAYYEGLTLQQRMARGPATIDEAIDIVSQVASGLAKAHESDIFHRDIKPANILLTTDGHAKIVDFGLAKLTGQTRLTKTGTTVGTVSYMSPEQARGEDIDSRADVFSTGVVLYEFLTGKLPFRGDHEAAVVYSIINSDPEPLTTHRSDLSVDTQRVIDKALAKDRDERYARAADLLTDLKKLQEGRQVAALERKAKSRIGRRAAIYALLGIAVVAAGIMLWPTSPEEAKSPAEQMTSTPAIVVAVLPFSVRGGSEVADLGEGIADLLSARLAGAGAFESVDPRALSSFIERNRNGVLGPENGRGIAEHFGAERFLLGNVMDVGGRLHVNASMYQLGGQAEPLVQVVLEGDHDDLLALVDDLAAQVVIDQLGGVTKFPFDPDALTTRSFPALKAFFAGEARFHADASSGPDFQRAVELDSTFALALYRLAVIRWWPMGSLVEAQQVVNQALRHSVGLPEREILRLKAFRAELYEDDGNAEQLFRTIVSNYPEDHEAWFRLGATLALSSARRGVPPGVAREALERALALDPQNWQASYYLTVLVLFERDYDTFQKLIREKWPNGDIPIRYRANLAFAVGDRQTQEQIISELRNGGEGELMWSASRIALYTDDPRRSQDVARLMTDPVRSDEVRGLGHIMLAYLEAAQGRWKAAADEFRAAERFNPAVALEFRALVATMPFLVVPAADLEAIRDTLVNWQPHDADLSLSPQPWFKIYDDIHPHLRVYLLGLLSTRLGELERALEYAADMERLSGPPHVTGLMQDFAQGLRADVAWQQGDAQQALAEIQKIKIKSPANYRVWSPFFKESHERYLRAELLHELGRDEEAIAWTSSFGHIFGFEFVYLAPLHYRRGQYFEKLGQLDQAAKHYALFVKFWEDCDAELRPLVEDARRKLDILAAPDG